MNIQIFLFFFAVLNVQLAGDASKRKEEASVGEEEVYRGSFGSARVHPTDALPSTRHVSCTTLPDTRHAQSAAAYVYILISHLLQSQ